MISKKTTLAANDKKVFQESTDADAAVHEYEQASSDDEEIELKRTSLFRE
jgi:hypothetical protein